MATHDFGRFYWCIKSDLSPTGEIYAYADRVEVNGAGSLLFIKNAEEASSRPEMTTLAFSAGSWKCFFAASVMDGAAASVEHWEGEVTR